MKESPIFTRTYDLLKWLIPATVKLPRSQRFVMAAVLQQCAFSFQAHIIEAAQLSSPGPALNRADIALTQLRTHLRLSHDLGLFNKGQYYHVAAMVNEIGRLLGGWKKTV